MKLINPEKNGEDVLIYRQKNDRFHFKGNEHDEICNVFRSRRLVGQYIKLGWKIEE